MEVIRKNKIVRSNPEKNPNGTPLGKTPEIDLGTQIIPKERYISDEFMEKEWEKMGKEGERKGKGMGKGRGRVRGGVGV